MWKRRTSPGALTTGHYWQGNAVNSLCGLMTSSGVWIPTKASRCGLCEQRLNKHQKALSMLDRLTELPALTPDERIVAAVEYRSMRAVGGWKATDKAVLFSAYTFVKLAQEAKVPLRSLIKMVEREYGLLLSEGAVP